VEGHRIQILVDAWTRDPTVLENPDRTRAVLLRAAREAGAVVIGEQFHRFSPAGYTGYILLSESHIAVHSWVDEGLLTVDVFACQTEQSRSIVDRFCADLDLGRRRVIEVRRGEEPDHEEEH